MKVKDLIRKLQEHDPEKDVVMTYTSYMSSEDSCGATVIADIDSVCRLKVVNPECSEKEDVFVYLEPSFRLDIRGSMGIITIR